MCRPTQICLNFQFRPFSLFSKNTCPFYSVSQSKHMIKQRPPFQKWRKGDKVLLCTREKKYCVWQGTGIPVQARRSGKKIMAFEELDKKWLVGARRSYLGFAKVESARRGSVIECFQEIIHDHLQLWEGHKTTWIMLRAFQKGAGVDMRLVRLKVKQILQIWHTMITYSLHIMWCGIKKLYVHVGW